MLASNLYTNRTNNHSKKSFFVTRPDEDIPATLDVNKGDGLRHTSHEENEDDVNQVDGYVPTRMIKHTMVQLRAAVLGKYNKR